MMSLENIEELKMQSHGAYDRLRPVCDLYKTSRVR